MAALIFNEAFIQEFFFVSASSDDFEGFTQVDIECEMVGDDHYARRGGKL